MKETLEERLKDYIEDCKWTVNNLEKELEYWKVLDNQYKVIEYKTSIENIKNDIEVLTDILKGN